MNQPFNRAILEEKNWDYQDWVYHSRLQLTPLPKTHFLRQEIPKLHSLNQSSQFKDFAHVIHQLNQHHHPKNHEKISALLKEYEALEHEYKQKEAEFSQALQKMREKTQTLGQALLHELTTIDHWHSLFWTQFAGARCSTPVAILEKTPESWLVKVHSDFHPELKATATLLRHGTSPADHLVTVEKFEKKQDETWLYLKKN